jgi:glyoxylase-like metal-dependent hydrolase (beta-lactamase superfamily II)
VLIDTGTPSSAARILQVARQKYGANRPPHAIILTHAHFDHIGAARALLTTWPVPVYAHEQELPYLTGQDVLPPPDPTVGGLMATLAHLFPPSGTDLRPHVRPLPPNGAVPHLLGWQWLHTPGHTPGHISLWQAAQRILLAGDAVTTMNQQRLSLALSALPEINGPPTYETSDWPAAAASVARLAELQPRTLAAGHGLPLTGPAVSTSLHDLADHFTEHAIPRHGRYVGTPARFDATGRVVALPPPPPDRLPLVLGAAALVGVGSLGAWALLRQPRRNARRGQSRRDADDRDGKHHPRA